MEKEKRDEVIINQEDPSVIIINGKKYSATRITTKKIDGVTHGDKVYFKPLDEAKFEADLDTVVNEIKKQTTNEELLKELIKCVSIREIKRLANKIRKGAPVKKQKGCLGFKIGKSYIQLID